MCPSASDLRYFRHVSAFYCSSILIFLALDDLVFKVLLMAVFPDSFSASICLLFLFHTSLCSLVHPFDLFCFSRCKVQHLHRMSGTVTQSLLSIYYTRFKNVLSSLRNLLIFS